jgi:hypothetical protein
MSQGASSLRFGDVICLGLEFSAGSDDEHMFYVLGHRSPLSLVEGCQDVIDNVLIAEIPNTFQSPSDDSITFPVPVHSREYWFEIVGKSEYMMQQMLQKLSMQLERLEAEEERMVRSNKHSPSSTSTIERRPSVAAVGGGTIQALRRRSHDARLDHDIELSQINVALLADAESPSYDAVSRAPHGGSNLSPIQALRRRSHDARLDHDIELSQLKSHQLPSYGADSGDLKPSSSSQAISRLKSRIADLTDLANGESQRNLENELSRDGSAVRYGDVIQLRHMSSKKFVTLASGSLSSYELSLGGMNCWFAFEPVTFNLIQIFVSTYYQYFLCRDSSSPLLEMSSIWTTRENCPSSWYRPTRTLKAKFIWPFPLQMRQWKAIPITKIPRLCRRTLRLMGCSNRPIAFPSAQSAAAALTIASVFFAQAITSSTRVCWTELTF